MAVDIRPLTAAEQPAAWDLGSLAFGYRDTMTMPDGWTSDSPGRHTLGAFADGRLLGKAVDREQSQYFGGEAVPVCGVAGVAVAPEARGGGVARQVLARLLAQARTRGAAVSTLFPTTAVPYRKLGWDEAGALTYYALPAASLAGVRADVAVTLRPATEGDLPAIHELYRTVARGYAGMMERTGPLFPPGQLLTGFHGVTVAESAGKVAGYATWDRSDGYHPGGTLTVDDLIAATPAALSSLLGMLATWASVAPTTVIRLGPADPAWLLVDSGQAKVDSRRPWMIRAVDAAAAIAARGWPDYLSGSVDLTIEDELCPWNAGNFRLVLGGRKAQLEPGGSGAVRMTARGFGLWYAGAQPPAVLRQAGLLSGDTASDELLQAATAGPPPCLHDYF